jgi:tetratricopeptide (TPR) repeat protein
MLNTNIKRIKVPLLAMVKFLLFIVLSAILSGCATSNHMTKKEEQYNPDVIDVDKFDPVDFFERMKVESEAREKSKITTCYLIGNVDIRFASAVESDKDKEPLLAYDFITNMKGRPYYISKTTALDSNDIEVLCVEKTSYRGNDQYSINLLFKKESWDKVNDVTRSLVKKKLAFIKEQTVISAPIVQEPLLDYAYVTGDLSRSDIDWFIQGLTPTTLPTNDNRDKALTEWLESRVQNYPDDSQSLTRLAGRYSEKKEKDCKKTGAIYEKVIRLDPVQYIEPFLELLHSCYVETGNYEKAITFYRSLINEEKIEPHVEVFLRMVLADAYANKGNTHKALEELEQALAEAKSLSLPYYPWLEKSPHKDQIERQLNNSKAKMIKSIEAVIEKVKSQEIK